MNIEFNLSDYMSENERRRVGLETTTIDRTDAPVAGRDYLKPIASPDARRRFKFYFKGRFATFCEVDSRVERNGSGEIVETIEIARGATGNIYYQARAINHGNFIFIGESPTQAVDKSERTREARHLGRIN